MPKRLVELAIDEKNAVVVPLVPVNVLKEAPLVALRVPPTVVEPVDETAKSVVVAPDVVVELMTKALGSCTEVEATRTPSHVPENGVLVPWMVGPRNTLLARVVRVPNCALAPKMFVDDAMDEKNAVVVALVVVELPVMVRLPVMVEEEFEMNPPFIVRRFENEFVPENVLLSLRSVDEAAVMVKVPPAVMVVLLIVARVPLK